MRINSSYFTLGNQQIISQRGKSKNSRVSLLCGHIVDNIRTAEGKHGCLWGVGTGEGIKVPFLLP